MKEDGKSKGGKEVRINENEITEKKKVMRELEGEDWKLMI